MTTQTREKLTYISRFMDIPEGYEFKGAEWVEKKDGERFVNVEFQLIKEN